MTKWSCAEANQRTLKTSQKKRCQEHLRNLAILPVPNRHRYVCRQRMQVSCQYCCPVAQNFIYMRDCACLLVGTLLRDADHTLLPELMFPSVEWPSGRRWRSA